MRVLKGTKPHKDSLENRRKRGVAVDFMKESRHTANPPVYAVGDHVIMRWGTKLQITGVEYPDWSGFGRPIYRTVDSRGVREMYPEESVAKKAPASSRDPDFSHRGWRIESTEATQMHYATATGKQGKGRKVGGYLVHYPEGGTKTVPTIKAAKAYIDAYLGPASSRDPLHLTPEQKSAIAAYKNAVRLEDLYYRLGKRTEHGERRVIERSRVARAECFKLGVGLLGTVGV